MVAAGLMPPPRCGGQCNAWVLASLTGNLLPHPHERHVKLLFIRQALQAQWQVADQCFQRLLLQFGDALQQALAVSQRGTTQGRSLASALTAPPPADFPSQLSQSSTLTCGSSLGTSCGCCARKPSCHGRPSGWLITRWLRWG